MRRMVALSMLRAASFGAVPQVVAARTSDPAWYRLMLNLSQRFTGARLFPGPEDAAINLQAAALRGSGNVRVPALVTLVGALVTIPLSPILIFGLGPFPRLGIGGAGIAFGLYYSAAMLFLLPSFLGFMIFMALPILASLALSFTNWQLISTPSFVGLQNYIKLFTVDPAARSRRSSSMANSRFASFDCP